MDRANEYQLLLEELEQTPSALADSTRRALHRQKRRRAVQSALASVCAVLVAFVVLVNTFPSFAYACGRVPLLRDLAQAVALSPSLSAAVENQYVQPIEKEQSAGEVTARVEYVIVDQKQVNIFYTLDSPRYQAMTATPSIASLTGEDLEGYSISMSNWGEANGELQQCTVDFVNGEVPPGLCLTLAVEDHGSWEEEGVAAPRRVFEEAAEEAPVVLAELQFDLTFDPAYTAKGEIITLDQPIELDGQELIVTTAEIYPTHIRINFSDVPENTAWLHGLSFYLENEKGQRFEAIGNGISATGSPDSPMMTSHRLESSYFSGSQHLTMHITQVTWLDKDMERVRLDLKKTEAERLPQGVTFAEAKQLDDGWELIFWAKRYREHHSYQLWGTAYFDEEGNAYDTGGWSSGGSLWHEEDGKRVEDETQFMTTIPLRGYTKDVVYLCPNFTRIVDLEPDVSVAIK